MTCTTKPLLLSADETAKTLCISRRTLFTWTKSGDLPCVRIGARVLYDPNDLSQFIERLRTGAGAK